MGDYIRATRECSLSSLRPTLAAAIREHIEQHQLGDMEPSIVGCFETTSTKKKKGLFGGAEVMHTGMAVTPEWLFWATDTGKGRVAALSARLRDILVLDYEKTSQYKLIQDTGVQIQGRITDMPENASAFIGLGPEPAGQQFRDVLRATMAKGQSA